MSAELTKTSRIEAGAQACLQDFSLWRSHASEYTNTLTCQLVYSNLATQTVMDSSRISP